MHMKSPTNWTQRYLKLAKEISTWSKDPSTQIGAVVIGDEGQILSQGYNGFPRGIEDSEEKLNDKETKYDHIVHGEMNCIYNACLNGVSLKGSSLYVYGLPVCHICANGIIQVGIKKVYMAHDMELPQRWMESWEKTRVKFIESRIGYVRNGYYLESDDSLIAPRTLESAGRVNGDGHYITRRYRWDESLGQGVWDREYF